MRWFIGDVHGHRVTLECLLDTIYTEDSEPQFVFLGDYGDRGPDSKGVIDVCLSLNNAYFVRGNHDDIISYIVNDDSLTPMKEFLSGQPDKTDVVRWWFNHGFREFCASYGVSTDVHIDDPTQEWQVKLAYQQIIDSIQSAMPDSHKQFLKDLPIYYEDDTHFAMHAYWSNKQELPRDLRFINFRDRANVLKALWSRFSKSDLTRTPTAWDKIGVFGHFPTSNYKLSEDWEPISYDKIRLIDTGVCFGGALTAYCAETESFIMNPCLED